MNSPNRNLAIVKAVREQGEPVTKVAKRFRISRQRVYKILSQFEASWVWFRFFYGPVLMGSVR